MQAKQAAERVPKDNEGRASEAGGRKESETMTKTMQAKQAAEKKAKTKRGPCKRSRRPKREQNDNEGRAGLCRAVLAVLGCAWLCLPVLGCAWLFLAVLGCAWLCLLMLGYAWLCLAVLGLLL